MSKMAKFVAIKKKSSVKAKVDSSLQGALAAQDFDAVSDTYDSLKGSGKATTDDWGADSDNDAIPGHNLMVGGHFNLITEEDLNKKQQRKPRKWGEHEEKAPEKTPDEAPDEPPEVELDKPEASSAAQEEAATEEIKPEKPEPYRPPRSRAGATAHPKRSNVDVSDSVSFPSIDATVKPEPSIATSTAIKKKDNKKTEIREKAQDLTVEGSDADSVNKNGGTLMLIEEFLKDIVKPDVNFMYDDDASRAKFIGRKTMPRVAIPATEF